MDWWAKGLLTMASVALVLTLARRWGGSAAGIVAGLPTTTAPALGWMAHEQGATFAAQAAAATVAACALMAAFALAYAHASLRLRPRGVALPWGAAAALAMVGPVLAAGHHLLPALGLAGVCSLLAWRAWPSSCSEASACADVPARPWIGTALPAITAGSLSLGLAAAGPVIGTVAGLFGRMAFGTVFAAAVPGCGIGTAMALAAGAAVMVNLACMARLAGSPAIERLALAVLLQQGQRLGRDQCSSYAVLPVFAEGSFSVENMHPLPAAGHFTRSGRLHRQIQALPDGATC